ncbi:translational GTPase TypA [Spirochaeta cellobiosiphila]|uniref:translational GTPase TypA n=1 Tax=Spirochaeta cellobiosiphila TaxID=504483 RepID=UPI000412D360|nr:translational GTPase TypA [Spirochaeta cellobiosiphila]
MSSLEQNKAIRNVAIIAHVDHGKTTLVDAMFKQSGIFREGQQVDDRLMDSMDLERERGITISAKNCSVNWKGVKINIIDTPGHADFGGEVERSLSMADGVILLVDASEGPLPQTRFVLQKALKNRLPMICIINKIDRADARPQEVLNEVYDLLIDLDATEDQLEFPLLYAIGRDGIAKKDIDGDADNLIDLFDTIVEEIPGPQYDPADPFQMLVADLDYSDFLGRICVGKVASGSVKANAPLVCIGADGKAKALRVSKLQAYKGMDYEDVDVVQTGDIIALAGIEEVTIGDTICTKERPVALPRIQVDEPTVSMKFTANTGPIAGQEGKFVQGSRIWERLEKEVLTNVAIKIEQNSEGEGFIVKGRGEFQMAILIETMRREGYELCVGRPEVIYKRDEDGKLLEPIEYLGVDCDEPYMGVVMEKLSIRKCLMTNMVNNGTGRVRMEFTAPSRSLIGYRDEFLTDTKGTGMLHSYVDGYEPFRGEFPSRSTGSLVADRQGKAVPYAIYNLEPRGKMFIQAGDVVYEGMVVGEHNRDNDLDVNPTKEKKLSNMRASGRDENVVLTPVVPLTLEQALNFIRADEMVEITPQSIRLRKTILGAQQRKQARNRK